jgi:internalin A
MSNLSPVGIFNDFRGGKIDKSTVVELIKKQKSVDFLLELYKIVEEDASKEAFELKLSMEETLGKKFITKHNIVPREALALGLFEKTIGQEILNEEEYPEFHHVHALYREKNGHVTNLDIVEICCPRIMFMEFFPNLIYLTICMADLKEIKGLEFLSKLEYLNLASNELTEIIGLERLTNLKRLDLNLNKISELSFSSNLGKLEELLLSFNPLKKLSGFKKLKNLRHIEVENVDLSKTKTEWMKKSMKLN